MQKIFISAIILLLGVLLVAPGRASAGVVESGQLIKASGAAVYYYFDGKRYVFPNEDVYFSWYDDFNMVQTISDSALASVPIGGNATFRPGTKLIKIVTDPKVYAILEDNKLRWLANEDVAKALYGDEWAKEVRDVSDAFFLNYEMGEIYDTIEGDADAVLTVLSAARLKYNNYSSILNNFISNKNIGNIDSFLHPENITIVSIGKTGYMASTTLSLDEVVNYFVSNSGDWQLRFDHAFQYATGTLRMMNYRMMNYSKTHADNTFSHRSVLVTSQADNSYRELSFQEITYPKGYLAYPNATTFDYVEGDSDLRHTVITNSTKDEVVNWYSTVSKDNGWESYQEQENPLGIFYYYKAHNKDSSRAMEHLYMETGDSLDGDKILIFGTEYNKMITY